MEEVLRALPYVIVYIDCIKTTHLDWDEHFQIESFVKTCDACQRFKLPVVQAGEVPPRKYLIDRKL
jgi:hypothetical protein